MISFRTHFRTFASMAVVALTFINNGAIAQTATPPSRERPPKSGTGKSNEGPLTASQSALPVQVKTATSSESIKAGQSLTTITSKKGAYLDSKASMATFTGDVTVVDARFSLTCQKLTAFLVRQGNEPKGEVGNASGLDKVEAEGDVVIIQDKVGEKGDVERSLARAQKAVYDSQTGNITLSGWPQVEQNQNVTMAAEEGTVIVLNRKGKLEVLGHSKSILRNTSTNDGH